MSPSALARALLAGAVCVACSAPAGAEDALVAVATNFRSAADGLVAAFRATPAGRGHQIDLVAGSTGKLYSQISHGAPYHAFLAADTERPKKLIAAGLAARETYAVYAVGRLAFVGGDEQSLRSRRFSRLAMANPRLAPYGLAAERTLASLGLTDKVADRLVLGENVGQAWAMVQLGGADAGLVAASQVEASTNKPTHWLVPSALHPPIEQAMVALARGANNTAGIAFLSYVRSDPGRAYIAALGYDAPELEEPPR